MLNAIKNNNFKERLPDNEFLLSRSMKSFDNEDNYKEYALSYLNEYKNASGGNLAADNFNEWQDYSYPLPKDNVQYYEFYKKYYAFLRKAALSLQGKRQYSPLEDYLLRFYANPDSVKYAELDSAIYAGTFLQEQYLKYKKYNDEVHGISSNIHVGMWVPNGNLALLGSHPYFSYAIGGRSEQMIWEMIGGLRAGESPKTYKVQRDDSLYDSKNFFSWYIGLDMGTKLFRTKKSELDVLWGVGVEGLQVLNIWYKNEDASTSSNAITKSLNTFYANAGLGYRIYVTDKITKNRNHVRRYFSLQAKYNYVNYNNEGGTDLKGNYLTIGLVYGVYSNSYKKYLLLDN
jgi:hypothetical protein